MAKKPNYWVFDRDTGQQKSVSEEEAALMALSGKGYWDKIKKYKDCTRTDCYCGGKPGFDWVSND